jgi:hypothetical protein
MLFKTSFVKRDPYWRPTHRIYYYPVMVSRSVAAVVAALLGCKSSEPPAPAVTLPELQLVSAGSEPRRVLRYRPAKGTRAAFELAIDLEVDAGGMGAPMPTFAFELELAVDDVLADGRAALRMTVTDASVREAPGSMTPQPFAGPVEATRGLVVTATMSPGGKLSDATLAGEATSLTADAQAQVASLIGSLEQVAMVFPPDPVGIGAVWRSSRAITQSGIRMTAVNTVTLTAIDGDTLSYEIDSTVHGPDQTIQQGGVSLTVKDITGRGTGVGTVHLVTLATSGQISADYHNEVAAAGEAGATKIRIAARTTVTPR